MHHEIKLSVLLNVDDDEADIYFEYDSTPGSPATGPTYDCGGEPAEGAECELQATTIDGFANRASWPPFVLDQIEALQLQAYELACEEADEGDDYPEEDRDERY